MNLLAELFTNWPWKMALRDARHSAVRLIASAATIALGVGVLVAVGSLSTEIAAAVRAEAKGLLGADLSIRVRGDWTPAIEERLAALGAVDGREIARQIQLTTVASFPRTGAVRQARVRAIEGNYPWYGSLETAPPSALDALRAGTGALVDESLLRFGGATIGDPIRIGTNELPIAGAVVKVPGETAANALFGARVYVPLATLDPSLLDRGSRVERSAYVLLAPNEDPERVREDLSTFARENQLSVATARSVESNWNRSADRLHDYLHLAALAALLLGGLGVGSAMHLHARRKREIVATLRCLGAPADRAFAAFAAQALLLGVIGTALGATLGIAVHRTLPLLFADFLPVAIEGRLSLVGIAGACTIGIGFALLAALFPLMRLRSVPPVDALRASTLGRAATIGNNALFLGLLYAVITLFGWLETGRARTSFEYATFFFAGGGALVIVGVAVVALARAFAHLALPFGWRYAIANLRRPDNQTPVLLVTLGLGALILTTIDQSEAQLYATIDRATSGVRPNVVFFDVQRDQVDSVKGKIAELGAPLVDDVPVVTMRLAALEGRRIADIRKDRDARVSGWALGREYRSTYRDRLADTEETIAGAYPALDTGNGAASFGISLEDDIARQLGVTIGDSITWDVQGIEIETRVAHLRRVEWQRLSPNFFAVFPTAALAEAPQFRIISARAADPNAIGALQAAVAAEHPGVSAVDVGVVLEVADELLGKIGLVLRAMGFICLVSGGLVLLGAWLGTRRERMIESALLRALGAPVAFVRKIAMIEAAALGVISALAGSSLGVLATYLLAEHRFGIPFDLAAGRLAALMAGVALFGVLTAALAGRGVHRAPPLEVLRED
jgi:putative ABC transport system permease protein